MPSLISATVLFFAVGFCSAGCTRSRTPTKPSATVSAHQSSSTLPTIISSTLAPASSTPSMVGSYVPTVSPAEPTSTTSQNTTSGSSIIDGFKPGAKWQIAIQDPIDPRGGIQPVDANIVDVDLFLASKDSSLIPTLHVCCRTPWCRPGKCSDLAWEPQAAGAVVLCYFVSLDP